MIGTIAGLVLAAAVVWVLGLTNVLRTWGHPATADYVRRDDPDEGGVVFEVRPARASRLPVLVLAPLCLALGLLWSGLIAILLGVGVAAIFLAPGARHRRAARITVTPRSLRAGDVELHLDRLVEITVCNTGVAISSEPLVAGPGGVSTSSLVGRGLARRQVGRSYAVQARGDGESHARVLAGGLTEECARNLVRDLERAVAQAQPTAPR